MKHIKTQQQLNEDKKLNLSDVSDSVLNEKIKTYIQNNLSVEISSETNDFMSTDGSTLTRFSVKLLLDGKEISSDSYYG
jgi:hypothetical protein